MRSITRNGLTWLTFDLFSDCPRLVHGVFLRHGGVSQGPFDSLNFGLMQGDLADSVTENKRRALKALGISQFVQLHQIHSNRLVEAKEGPRKGGDGLLTNDPNLGLMILHADCQAAIFYDPIHHTLAAVHSGWRGSVANIYQETLLAMRSRYGSRPEDLLVGISPSLGPLAAEFRNYRTELPESFWSFQVKPTYFDFWEISRAQLMAGGVLPHHIEVAELCTYTNTDDFFSYRRMKASGRHATIAALKP